MYNIILKHCYFNVTLDLERQFVHFLDGFWSGTMSFKTLVSAVGGTKNFFNSKLYTYLVEMVSSFSSLSGHCER